MVTKIIKDRQFKNVLGFVFFLGFTALYINLFGTKVLSSEFRPIGLVFGVGGIVYYYFRIRVYAILKESKKEKKLPVKHAEYKRLKEQKMLAVPNEI